jgi:hypothetical protein
MTIFFVVYLGIGLVIATMFAWDCWRELTSVPDIDSVSAEVKSLTDEIQAGMAANDLPRIMVAVRAVPATMERARAAHMAARAPRLTKAITNLSIGFAIASLAVLWLPAFIAQPLWDKNWKQRRKA